MERHQLYYSLLLRFFLPLLLFSRDMVIDGFEYLQLTVWQNGWSFLFCLILLKREKVFGFYGWTPLWADKKKHRRQMSMGNKSVSLNDFWSFLLFLGDFCVTPWQMENTVSTFWVTFLIQQITQYWTKWEHFKELVGFANLFTVWAIARESAVIYCISGVKSKNKSHLDKNLDSLASKTFQFKRISQYFEASMKL